MVVARQGTPVTFSPLFADLRLPLMCAPMTLASSLPLAIASCRAGVVGGWQGGNVRTIEEFQAWLVALEEARKETEDGGEGWAPYAINFNAGIVSDPDLGAQKLAWCEKLKSPLFVTSVGDPTEITRRVHGWGGKVIHDVISIRFVEKAIAAGVDGLLLTCAGAGGHTGQLSPFAFVPKVRSMFDGLILAAGAIADGAGIAAALALGADMACMGTRFIATQESGAPEGHKRMIAEAGMEDIIQSDAMNGINAHWIRQSIEQVGLDPANLPAKRGPMRGSALPEGVRAWRDIWSAGHSAGLIHDIPTTREVVDRLIAQFEAVPTHRDWRARLAGRLS
jgi:nitronate monooxygenase